MEFLFLQHMTVIFGGILFERGSMHSLFCFEKLATTVLQPKLVGLQGLGG